MTKILAWLAVAVAVGTIVFLLVPGAPDLAGGAADDLAKGTRSADGARSTAADGARSDPASAHSSIGRSTGEAAPSTADFAIGQRLPPAMLEPAAEYPEIEWDALMPADWDPLAIFQDLDIDALDDADPRAIEALETLRAAWDDAPTNDALSGTAARIAGFLVPLDWEAESFREFLLVPYFGACIHTPPPPANQIIHVIADPPVTGQGMMEAIWVEGRFEIAASETEMGRSGYRMYAHGVTRYEW